MRKFKLFFCLFLIPGLLAACQSAKADKGSNLPSGSLLFQDDFSDVGSGWLQGKDEQGLTEYANGGLRIYVSSDVSSELSVLDRLSFVNTRVEVDMLKTGGPDDNDFGIVCRYIDENNFYFLEISSDGYYGIGKYKDNQLSLISANQMQSSDAIHQGSALNHIRADCNGSRLTLYANGSQLASVEDKDFLAGKIGLIAGSFKTPGVDMLFDNLSVLAP